MKMKYNDNDLLCIEVKDGKNKTYSYRSLLYSYGFLFEKKTKTWKRRTRNKVFAEQMRTIAHDNRLACIIYTNRQIRSKSYRTIFFDNNDPMFGKHYVCAYCLKPLIKTDVTVDHIIPVKKAQANESTKWLMKRLGIDDVNDPRNLACACLSCNTRKGKKAGLWLVRGFLGKRKWFVVASYVFIATILVAIIVLMVMALHGNFAM